MENNKENKTGRNPFPQMEEEVLAFWDKAKIFDKSVNKSAPEGDYAFYDGPPFATGLPHYGHIVASVMKDAVPRYWTMKGYRVERKWGWDCHGLPIENLAEKELGLENKQDIEKLGVEKFNAYCRGLVLRYESEWKKIVKRIGRWVDMENGYKTMDTDYMESVWWIFKELYDKGLIYQGYKAMHICPRCGTTLSNFEVTQGYKDIKDLSAVVKFALAEEPGTYVLAWTTTPWTLIGNVALAINPGITYCRIKIPAQGPEDVNEESYIIAKARLQDIFKDKEYEIQKEFKGKDLIGLSYAPLFDYYQNADPANKENGWKIYPADFVSTEEGTGIVHIAPGFGEDDLKLAQEYGLPFIQHVDMAGKFKDEVIDWPGLEVKPADDHMKIDIEIVKYLAHHNKLFSKEKYEHSYPHCWRCETPLLNYAAESWFVGVAKIKEALIGNNQGVNWVPAHVKEGRFGKWLENARDWSISRSRYWGDPLPIWKCDSCGELKVVGSIEELRQLRKDITRITLIRHGESEKNLKHIFDAENEGYALTERGIGQARQAAENLSKENIDAIYASPVERAKQTADIIAEKIGLKTRPADGLREVRSGDWDGRTIDDELVVRERSAYHSLPREQNYVFKRGTSGESWKDIEERAYNFLKEAVEGNAGKNIVLVTHQGIIVYLFKAICGLSLDEAVRLFDTDIIGSYAAPISVYFDPQTMRQVNLHKQFADKIEADCGACGGKMRRISEVLDCWFESGSMPYAQAHYPFENQEKFISTFPAQFIAEGIDQTRGWFYTLMVLSTGLFGQPAFKNVIVNGIVLAEDGQKMSKSKANFPDPALVFEKYSVDAMRYYLLSSQVLNGENLNFSEKGVEEVLRKVLLPAWNVYKFYAIFKDNYQFPIRQLADNSQLNPSNILDKWILARQDQLIIEVTLNIDKYQIPRAIRPIELFISDLSTWYLRRSRDRFKSSDAEDRAEALATTAHVLTELSKIIAPFMPFLAEQLWQKVTGHNFENQDKSVHLEEWPKIAESRPRRLRPAEAGKPKAESIIEEMQVTRKIVELALAKRDEAKIKVRQPLNRLEVRSKKLELKNDFVGLIKDEVNVKEVELAIDGSLANENEIAVKLDTAITPELKKEGIRREIVRYVNALRKEAGLTINDKIILNWKTDSREIKDAVTLHSAAIRQDTIAGEIREGKDIQPIQEKTVKIDGSEIWLAVQKA